MHWFKLSEQIEGSLKDKIHNHIEKFIDDYFFKKKLPSSIGSEDVDAILDLVFSPYGELKDSLIWKKGIPHIKVGLPRDKKKPMSREQVKRFLFGDKSRHIEMDVEEFKSLMNDLIRK